VTQQEQAAATIGVHSQNAQYEGEANLPRVASIPISQQLSTATVRLGESFCVALNTKAVVR
jgi:hypothetical protein